VGATSVFIVSLVFHGLFLVVAIWLLVPSSHRRAGLGLGALGVCGLFNYVGLIQVAQDPLPMWVQPWELVLPYLRFASFFISCGLLVAAAIRLRVEERDRRRRHPEPSRGKMIRASARMASPWPPRGHVSWHGVDRWGHLPRRCSRKRG
jgi:hypothetical protein